MACDTSTLTHLHKRCTVWTNGISWDTEEGIKTLVELIDHNCCVMVVISYPHESSPVEFCKHRSAVIRQILDLQQQLCPNVETVEYLTSHSFLRNWSATESNMSTIGSMIILRMVDMLLTLNACFETSFMRKLCRAKLEIFNCFKDALRTEPCYELQV